MKRRSVKRRVIIAALIAALIVVAAPLGLLAMASSETGSRWLIRQAARFIDGEVNVGRIQGALLSDITLHEIEYRNPPHRATVGSFNLAWTPRSLLRGLLQVRRLAASEIDYAGPEPEDDPDHEPAALPEIHLPLAIRIDEAEISDLALTLGDTRHRIERASFAGRADPERVTVERFDLDAAPLQLNLSGHVNPAPPYAFRTRVDWSADLPQTGPGAGHVTLAGDLQRIEIDLKASSPFELTTSGAASLKGETPSLEMVSLDLAGNWQALRWPLVGDPQYLSSTGSYRLQGTLDAMKLDLEAQLASDALPIDRVHLALDGGAHANAPYPFRASLDWSVDLDHGAGLTGAGRFDGDANRIQLDHRLDTPFKFTTRGAVTLADTPEVDIAGDWQAFRWPLSGAPVYRSETGNYRVAGRLDDIRLTLDADVAGDLPLTHVRLDLSGGAAPEPPFPLTADLNWSIDLVDDVTLAGNGKVAGNTQRLRFDHRTTEPFTLETEGTASLADDTPSLDLKGHWKSLRWPLSGTADYSSADGRFALSGPLDAYRLSLDGNFEGREIPPGRVQLALAGNAERADVESLTLETLDGAVITSGRVTWAPELQWDLDLAANDLNPGARWPEWPGALGLKARTEGELRDGTLSAGLSLEQLNGRLRGYPVEASGDVRIVGDRLSASDVVLRSGQNQARVSGNAADTLDLTFAVEAPALEQLWPDLDGRLRASGAVTGARDTPRIDADLSADRISFQDIALDALRTEIVFDPANAAVSKTRIEARGLQTGGNTVERVTLTGDGNADRHTINFQLESDFGDAGAQLSGSLDDRTWHGSLSRLDIESEAAGAWRLTDPVTVTASENRVAASRACLARAKASLCTDAQWAADTGIDVTGELDGLSLALAQPWLPDDLTLDGAMDGRFAATGKGDGLAALVDAAPRPGTVTYRPPRAEPVAIAWGAARFTADYRNDALQAAFALELTERGRADGKLNLGALTPQGGRSLDGEIVAEFPDLTLLEAFVPTLTDVTGALSLSADVGGTVQDPALQGRLEVRGAGARIADIGLQLRDLSATAQSRGSDLIAFRGEVSSGPGTLNLDGTARLSPEAGWPVELSVKGNDFQVVKLPEAQAFVSPDLSLAMRNGSAEVTGTLRVPRANVEIKELPESAVSVSGDEVIIDGRAPPPEETPHDAPPLRSRVELTLGDKVWFKGFGLTTRVVGGIEVSGRPGQVPLAQGTLDFEEGKFKGYGQDLIIESGRLLFSGPIDNPTLDIRAIRKANDVTAGLNITGPANNPRTEIFSEPALSEAEALSYLLTGRSLAGASATESAALNQAALSLKLGGLVAPSIGQAIGLDEFSVDSSAGVEQSSLLVGKYLTPDLYVSYALGLFDRTGTVLLRYRLTDRLSLESQSGVEQGIDLIYSIERD